MPFSSLGLSPSLLKALAAQNYTQPYPIQKEAIPAILNRKDVLAFQMDTKLTDLVRTKEEERVIRLIDNCSSTDELGKLKSHLTENITHFYEEKWNDLQEK